MSQTKTVDAVLDSTAQSRWNTLGGPGFYAGLAIPLFSLRTDEGMGIGEIPDLKILIQWVKKIGFKIIQLLPLNDTGNDPSPYSAVSSLALNPVYLSLRQVRGASLIQKQIETSSRKLNASGRLNYEHVRLEKLKLLRILLSKTKDGTLADQSFQKFRKENPWLQPYAAFSVLKIQHDQAWWREWPASIRKNPEKAIADVSKKYADECLLFTFIQWQLDEQMRDVHSFARKNNVALKGDIPILMNDDSVDIWMNERYIKADLTAGAPPDMFTDKGQNWGLPVYNWDELEKDDYRWWKNRMKAMEKYYDLVRIDHVLGFFRIWTVPAHESTARLGFFDPALPIRKQSLKKIGFSDEMITQLSEPHFSHKTLKNLLGPELAMVKKTVFQRIPGKQRYIFAQSVSGEKKIDELFSGKPELRDKLWRLWADRMFLKHESHKNMFLCRWAFTETSGFLSLTKQLQRNFLTFLKEHHKKQDQLWKKRGEHLMTMLRDSTTMLVCAEDLGYVPAVVPEVLNKLGILGLKVERWTRDYEKSHSTYIEPSSYPLLSVATSSVHDSTTIRGWWEESYEERVLYYQKILRKPGPVPDYLTTEIAARIIERLLTASSALVIFPLQDILALTYDFRTYHPEDERINVPGTVSDRNWSYRMAFRVSDLLRSTELNSHLLKLVKRSKR